MARPSSPRIDGQPSPARRGCRSGLTVSPSRMTRSVSRRCDRPLVSNQADLAGTPRPPKKTRANPRLFTEVFFA
jgi:hypothetical protein